MYCPNCGTQNADHARYCMHCAAPLMPASQSPLRPSNLAGITSLVLGCVACVLLFTCCCFNAVAHGMVAALSIVGIVMGIIGICKFARRRKANTLAILGLVFSTLSFLLILMWLVFEMFLFTPFGDFSLIDPSLSYDPYFYYS